MTGPSVAYIHAGAPKTGTTYLQRFMWASLTELNRVGVSMPGQRQHDHFQAGHDLRGDPFDESDDRPSWTGAWDRLAARARAEAFPTIVISDERLAAVTAEQAKRAVDSLHPRRVEVIYSVRDLGSLLPSEWQEFVKHGSTESFDSWIEDVLARRAGWFWRVHDASDVLDRWSSAVGRDRVHLLTVPPHGSPQTLLWERFSTILGIDPAAATPKHVRSNVSLGYAQTELLRRVNESLPGDFPAWHRVPIVRDQFAVKILGSTSKGATPSVDPSLWGKVSEVSTSRIAALREWNPPIVGSFDDLALAPMPANPVHAPSDSEILDVAVEAWTRLLVIRSRRRSGVSSRVEASPGARVKRAVLAREADSAALRSILRVYRSRRPL